MEDEAAALIDRWRQAESKLYPLVLVNPHQYEINLRLLRRIVEMLVDVDTLERLIERYDSRLGLLAEAGRHLSLTVPDGEMADIVVAAAFYNRHGAVEFERHRQDIRRRLADADAGWMVLAENGRSPLAGGYRRLEVRLPDGAAIHAYVDIDPDTYAPVYGIETLIVDPTTGEELGGPIDRYEFGSSADWEAAIGDLRE